MPNLAEFGAIRENLGPSSAGDEKAGPFKRETRVARPCLRNLSIQTMT